MPYALHRHSRAHREWPALYACRAMPAWASCGLRRSGAGPPHTHSPVPPVLETCVQRSPVRAAGLKACSVAAQSKHCRSRAPSPPVVSGIHLSLASPCLSASDYDEDSMEDSAIRRFNLAAAITFAAAVGISYWSHGAHARWSKRVSLLAPSRTRLVRFRADYQDRRTTFTDVMQIVGVVLDEVARARQDPIRPVT